MHVEELKIMCSFSVARRSLSLALNKLNIPELPHLIRLPCLSIELAFSQSLCSFGSSFAQSHRLSDRDGENDEVTDETMTMHAQAAAQPFKIGNQLPLTDAVFESHSETSAKHRYMPALLPPSRHFFQESTESKEPTRSLFSSLITINLEGAK